MAAKAPKPWKLTEEESFASYTSWQHNIAYNLSLDNDFKGFLKPGATWLKSSSASPLRGFTDDDAEGGKKAADKLHNLQQMLGLISQWVPHYLATDIMINSTSMDSIWQFIRKYYGFQQSEAQFMKFSSITWQDGERPERLYQRILAHLQDNLLCSGSRLKHNDATPSANEEISPTVERLAVLRWMELLHPSLPSLVQRTFARDLQRMTLKDLQPQIVDALDGFMEELRQDDVRASRIYAPPKRSQARQQRSPAYQHITGTSQARIPPPRRRSPDSSSRPQLRGKESYHKAPVMKQSCRVCKAEGRRYLGHDFFTCDYVSKAEKRETISAHQVDIDEESDEPYEVNEPDEQV